jgi:hypothetical protein
MHYRKIQFVDVVVVVVPVVAVVVVEEVAAMIGSHRVFRSRLLIHIEPSNEIDEIQ